MYFKQVKLVLIMKIMCIPRLALGRKNYLFAGSHKAAERAAGIYSFSAICKKTQLARDCIAFLQNIPILIPRKNIQPFHNGKTYKIKSFWIMELVIAAGVAAYSYFCDTFLPFRYLFSTSVPSPMMQNSVPCFLFSKYSQR